jgi:hypothetical protein
MNGIKSSIVLFEGFNFLNQNKKVEYLKDFIETLEKVDKTERDIFDEFEEMYSSLRGDKAKNEVKEAVNNKIEELTKENKRIEPASKGSSDLGERLNRCRAILGKRLYSNEELIGDLELIRHIAGS